MYAFEFAISIHLCQSLVQTMIAHNCFRIPDIYIHTNEGGTTLFPLLWVKSCLQLSKCLENSCGSSLAVYVAAELEKMK